MSLPPKGSHVCVKVQVKEVLRARFIVGLQSRPIHVNALQVDDMQAVQPLAADNAPVGYPEPLKTPCVAHADALSRWSSGDELSCDVKRA